MMKDDREMHVKAADAKRDEVAERAQAALREQSAANAADALAPKNGVRAMIEITMMEDGSFHMNGPWHDQLLFRGLMDCAREAMNENFKRLVAEVAAKRGPRVQPVTGVPAGVIDKLRQRGA